MANVTNKTTLQYLTSVGKRSRYPTSEWVIHDTKQKIADVEAITPIYRKVVGDAIREMNASEKAIKDQEIADAAVQAEANAKNIDLMQKSIKVLAILTFKEINKLRVKDGDSKYTWTEFKNAYKSEWDAL